MVDWTLLHMRSPLNTTAGTGQVRELTRATNRKLTLSTDAEDTLSFDMPGNLQQTAEIEPLVSDVLAFRGEDPTPVQRYRVVTRALSKDSTLTASFTAVSYRALLDAWIFHDGDTRSFATSTEQAAIAWTILSEGQAKPNGSLGISRGVTPQRAVMRKLAGSIPEGGTRPEYFLAGMKRREAIDNLAAMVDGFEWDIRPDPSDPYRSLVFDTWNVGTRNQHATDFGGRSPLVLDDGGSLSTWSHAVTPTDYGNVIRYTGDDSTKPVWRPAEDPTTPASEGRWERDLSNSDLTTQAAVADAAPTVYDQAHIYVPEITCTLRRGIWQGPAQLWIADQARLIITEGVVDDHGVTLPGAFLLYIDENVRVVELSIDVDDLGAEDVSLSLNRPAFSTRKNNRTIYDRLNRLERR